MLKKIKDISLIIPCDTNSSSIWVQKRVSKDDFNNLLEFPGGKVEPLETPIMAAAREFREEVGLSISTDDLDLFDISYYQYENFDIRFYTFILKPLNVLERLAQYDGQWVSDFNALESQMPPANREILQKIKENIFSF